MKKRILILGGGFGGIYTAMRLEKLLKKNADYEIALINRENYFVYQPMLAEVVGGSLGLTDTVSPLQDLLPNTCLYIREITKIDPKAKKVLLAPKFSHTALELDYEHLVVGIGNVTDFRSSPGLHEHAMPFKTLTDAIDIRNHLISLMQAAANEENPEFRKRMLTFVVGGGGFSGVEVVAELNDLVRRLAKRNKLIEPEEVRVVLIHSGTALMERELSPSLSEYAGKILAKRGVEILFEERLKSATPDCAILENGTVIESKTVISTVPGSPNPLIEKLDLPQQRGKLLTDSTFHVQDNLWALGDCAAVPSAEGGLCPPTAQFAVRQGQKVADNIVATIEGKELKPFNFKVLGVMAALGHHHAVAELFGKIRIRGIIAWLMWRFVYLMKIPGFLRKFRIGISWMLETLLMNETVQLNIGSRKGTSQLHYEDGGVIFYQGDVGDYLYRIVKGSAEVTIDGKTVATLHEGDFFGEMALLGKVQRNATVKAKGETDLIAFPRREFGMLLASFPELKCKFDELAAARSQKK